MSIYKFWFTVLTYLFFFCLFYFEPLYLGPIKFAILWKGFLFVVILLLVIIKGKIPNHPVILLGFFLAIIQFLSLQALENLFETIIYLFNLISVPILVIGLFLVIAKDNDPDFLINFFFKHLVSFVGLSTIPFHINLISPLGKTRELLAFDSYGIMFTGFFQTPHAASFIFGVCLVMCTWFVINCNSKMKFFYLFIMFLLGYSLVATYVRIGLAVFVLGLIPIIWSYKAKPFVMISSFMVVFVVINFLAQNELFINRLFDQRIHGLSGYDLSLIGSGRLIIWANSLQIFASASLYEQLFGIGTYEFLNRMDSNMSHKIFSHNGFLDVLNINGLVGLILFLAYLFAIWKCCWKTVLVDLRPLLISIFFCYLVMLFVQGDDNFIFALVLASIVTTKVFYKSMPQEIMNGKAKKVVKEIK
jgi:O-antigen ligase